MTVTASSFRVAYPEFTSAKYPDATVTLWLGFAVQFVNADRWGDSTDLGVMLWTAHTLSTMGQAGSASNPGQVGGVLTSKGAAGVSAGYDFASISEKDAGFWNATTYGRMFFRLSNLFGAGPVQVGTDGGQITTNGFPGFPY